MAISILWLSCNPREVVTIRKAVFSAGGGKKRAATFNNIVDSIMLHPKTYFLPYAALGTTGIPTDS